MMYLYMQNQQLELFNKNKSLNLKEKKEIFLRSIISKNTKVRINIKELLYRQLDMLEENL